MKRLEAVCSLIVPAKTIADVGCDHGLVAEYCAGTRNFERVIASDISAACLDKARAALKDYDNVEFRCCDGIDYTCDEAVIAGMGGANICEILQNASNLPEILVLCPHRDADSVRRTLIKLGYGIECDVIIEDLGRFYFVLRARSGIIAQEPSELQYLFGMNCGKRDDTLKKYLTKLYNTYNIAPERNAQKLMQIKRALDAQNVN